MSWTDQVDVYLETYSPSTGWAKNKVFYSKDYPDADDTPKSADESDEEDDDDDVLHAVLILGYGFDNGKLYWIIQNSHGTSSGENGLLYMSEGEMDIGESPVASIEDVQEKKN
jgi:C1A family cysteine protease